MGQLICKLLRRQGLILFPDPLHILDPRLVLPLKEGQENLFLRLKIVINRSACKRGPGPDIAERNILKPHSLIQQGTGINDFFFSCIRQLF